MDDYWAGSYETIYTCRADTLMADAFRKAAGMARHREHGCMVASPRESVYAGVDWEKLMGQRYGVRL